MKISVIQENLSKALNVVNRVVSSRASLAVLSNIMLKINKGQLEVTGTNLEMAIVYKIGAKVEKDGALSVPARLLTDLVSSLPNDKLLLSSDNNNLKIKTNNFESSINGISSDEFPTIPEVKPDITLSFPSDILSTALNQVCFAAALDESRPVLSGVLFSIKNNKLLLASTDSYRLAESIIDLSSKPKKDIDFIVPAKTIAELIRILTNSDGEIEIKATATEIEFTAGSIRLISRLIEGKFPDYQKIIPEKSETAMVIDTAELVSTVKVASLFARETANTIKLNFELDKLVITSSAAQIGDNQSSIPAKIVGEVGEISLNARYLTDVLAVIKADQVKLAINSKLNPCLITPHSQKTIDNYRHIIMPLRS